MLQAARAPCSQPFRSPPPWAGRGWAGNPRQQHCPHGHVTNAPPAPECSHCGCAQEHGGASTAPPTCAASPGLCTSVGLSCSGAVPPGSLPSLPAPSTSRHLLDPFTPAMSLQPCVGDQSLPSMAASQETEGLPARPQACPALGAWRGSFLPPLCSTLVGQEQCHRDGVNGPLRGRGLLVLVFLLSLC